MLLKNRQRLSRGALSYWRFVWGGFGLLLSETQSNWEIPSGSSACFLTSLFHEGNPSGSSQPSLDNDKRKADTLADSEGDSQNVFLMFYVNYCLYDLNL